jgi:hypothetical protein
VSGAPPLARIAVGVVVERRKAMGRWADFIWQPIGVLPGQPETPEWTILSASDDRTRYYAGGAEVRLYRTETAHYRDNLTAPSPSLWVVLRATGGEPPYRVVAVTADPAEGESFTQAGDDLVEAILMPDNVREMVEAFVLEHHVERTPFKRERKRADPEALARRSPDQKDRTE